MRSAALAASRPFCARAISTGALPIIAAVEAARCSRKACVKSFACKITHFRLAMDKCKAALLGSWAFVYQQRCSLPLTDQDSFVLAKWSLEPFSWLIQLSAPGFAAPWCCLHLLLHALDYLLLGIGSSRKIPAPWQRGDLQARSSIEPIGIASIQV